MPQGDAAATITDGKINVANVTLRAQDGSALALAGALDLGTASDRCARDIVGPNRRLMP